MNSFIELNKLPLKEIMKDGLAAFTQTENLTLAYTILKPGVEIPLHRHEEEAIDILLEGELEMTIGGSTDVLKNGMISLVASNIPHKAKAITDCKVVTVFYPARHF